MINCTQVRPLTFCLVPVSNAPLPKKKKKKKKKENLYFGEEGMLMLTKNVHIWDVEFTAKFQN